MNWLSLKFPFPRERYKPDISKYEPVHENQVFFSYTQNHIRNTRVDLSFRVRDYCAQIKLSYNSIVHCLYSGHLHRTQYDSRSRGREFYSRPVPYSRGYDSNIIGLMVFINQQILNLNKVLTRPIFRPKHINKLIFNNSAVQRFSIHINVSKCAKIRNRYNQVPHLTQDTNGKVTNSQ